MTEIVIPSSGGQQGMNCHHVNRKRRAVQPQGQPQDSAPPEHWPPPDAPFDL